jgi:UDP-N-acetylglucosamine:LPS N-acetylglucosamine transferase
MTSPPNAVSTAAEQAAEAPRHRLALPHCPTTNAAAPRVLIISGSVGAGHDGAARELARRLTERGAHVDQRDWLAAIPRPGQHLLREGYTTSVGYVPAFFEWLFQGIDHTRWVRSTAIAACRLGAAAVREWAVGGYDAIVSTYPLASQTLGQLKQSGRLNTPVATYLTDPAVHRLWVHRHVDRHLTVTQATAAQGEERYGVPMRAVGALVPPQFGRSVSPAWRASVRAGLGLDPARPIALVMAGSLGLGAVPAAVDAIQSTDVCDTLVLCGRNSRLRTGLAGRPGVTALGWRDDVADLMAASDVLVHNAGGLSLTEALVAGLPAVTYQPLPGHGRANAAVLEDCGLAAWPRTDQELGVALQRAIDRGPADRRHVQFEVDAADDISHMINFRRRRLVGLEMLTEGADLATQRASEIG